jgi:RNA polymerase sigma-70 factor (ECF subfamily)
MARPVNYPENVERLIQVARGGSRDSLGQLLEMYRPFLLLLARSELKADLQGKIGASDMVQETFLEAQRDFGRFRGRTHAELMAWLRRILVHNILNLHDHFLATGKRQASREMPLARGPDSSGQELEAGIESPSRQAIIHEESLAMQEALDRLPETYRQVLRLRHYEQRSFEEIGHTLGKSAEASRKLWFRAVERLRVELGLPHER